MISQIKAIDSEIESLKDKLNNNSNGSQTKKESQHALVASILSEMNSVYKTIDPYGNLHFMDLFTKRDEIYSGNEATVFHLSKLYAIRKVLNHRYPIIIDSFRAEDLSAAKENIVLDLYKSLPNQIIFTTTLKKEALGKYDSRTDLNHIDYKGHIPSKMLSVYYVDEFRELLGF